MGPNDQLRAVATELVKGCREGRERENLDKLYHPDAVSIEAFDMAGGGRETRGVDRIKAKHGQWEAMMEELPGGPSPEEAAQGPFYFGDDKFSVIYRAKMKNRQSGEIMDMTETAVYEVKDGKIVREEFYWAM